MSINWRTNKMWYILSIDYYLAMSISWRKMWYIIQQWKGKMYWYMHWKWNQLDTDTWSHMDAPGKHNNWKLSQRRQSQKTIYCITPFIWNVRIGKCIEIENRLVINRSWREESPEVLSLTHTPNTFLFKSAAMDENYWYSTKGS